MVILSGYLMVTIVTLLDYRSQNTVKWNIYSEQRCGEREQLTLLHVADGLRFLWKLLLYKIIGTYLTGAQTEKIQTNMSSTHFSRHTLSQIKKCDNFFIYESIYTL